MSVSVNPRSPLVNRVRGKCLCKPTRVGGRGPQKLRPLPDTRIWKRRRLARIGGRVARSGACDARRRARNLFDLAGLRSKG